MIELGKIQTLVIVKFTDFGAYLSDDKRRGYCSLLSRFQMMQI